jgi:hypothetical protein
MRQREPSDIPRQSIERPDRVTVLPDGGGIELPVK